MVIKAKKKVPAKVGPVTAPSQQGARPSYIPKQQVPDVPIDETFQPSINIVQMISNELVKGDPKFIKDAEAGMLFNTATRELFDGEEGVVLIPVEIKKYYTEWFPDRGGFVAQYEVKEEMMAQRDPKNDVAAVYEFTCVMEGAGEELVRVQFNSATKYPVAREWAKMIQDAGTVCGAKYKLTSVQRQNKAKQAYYTFAIAAAGWVTKIQYTTANTIMQSLGVPQIGDSGQEM